ncbi:MAG: PQQ-dependent sugar dehydrogenase [Planctomycetota bacterium]
MFHSIQIRSLPWLALVLAFVVGRAGPAAAQGGLPSGFALDTIEYTDGVGMALSLEFGPAGRMYIGQKNGFVRVYQPDGSGGYLPSTVFADSSAIVDTEMESGLLGLVLDPAFATNRFLYLFYTTSTDQRLVRVTADSTYNAMVAGSTLVLLSGLPRLWAFHKAGDIEFHPNDPNSIYISLGDDGIELSERIVRCPNPDYYEGKLLRVNKLNGQGLADNPFYDGNPNSVRSRVWATGFRNPFRMVFHPQAPVPNVVYVSENGDFIDRFSWVQRGSDGDWGTGSSFTSVPDPNHRILGSPDPSLVGIAIATSGPFSNGGNPVLYLSQWSGGASFDTGVRRFELTGPNLDTAVPMDGGGYFLSGGEGIDMTFGPDGALYLTGQVDSTRLIRRIRAVGGMPPIASFSFAPTSATGPAPFTMSFNDLSTDPDGVIVGRLWQFGDGSTSTATAPAHTYTAPGVYAVGLTVTDNSGLQTSATPISVTVVANTSIALSGQLYDGRNLSGLPLPVATELRFYQQDGLTPVSFAGGGGAAGNALSVPSGGVIPVGTLSLALTGSAVVISAGEPTADGMQPLFRGVPVVPGAQSLNLQLHLSNTAVRGRVRDSFGDAAEVDLGVARGGPTTWYSVAGGRDYLPLSGLTPTGVPFRVESDALGYYYVPIRTGTAGATFYFDVVADTGSATYLATAATNLVADSALVIRDYQLGLIVGGAGCDDLSGIPFQPSIDYLAQIQPIWNSTCTGCHHPAGYPPDLESNSEANLVGIQRATAPMLYYVDPGSLDTSFLFEKINCAVPQIGVRMRPGLVMPLVQQALVRDWILGQGTETFKRGDANDDGSFNLADAVAVLLYLFTGYPTTCQSAIDVNDDGSINVADAVYLLTALFQSGTLPPAPYLSCGADPTPGVLSCVNFMSCP